MSFRSKISRPALGLVLAFLGTACSSDGSNERAVQVLNDFITARFRSAPAIEAPVDRPYIVLSYGGGRTPMALISDNKGLATYGGPGGVEMTLNNGLLARLRGLGQEFEALYPLESGPYRDNLLNLSQSSKNVIRTVEYWIEQDPYRDRLTCAFTLEKIEKGLRRIAEDCKSLYSDLEIRNTYWTDNLGRIVLSRQWFHPKALPVDIDHRRISADLRRPISESRES